MAAAAVAVVSPIVAVAMVMSETARSRMQNVERIVILVAVAAADVAAADYE